MLKEIIDRWKDLEIQKIVEDLGKKLYPASNYFPQNICDDGLIEMTVEEHEGFDDENPREYMRFSFEGDHLLIRMTKNNKPFLALLETKNINSDELKENIQEFVARK